MKVGSDWDSRILTGDEFKHFKWKTEKQEIEMLNYGGGLKADENWMSTKFSSSLPLSVHLSFPRFFSLFRCFVQGKRLTC